MYSQKAQLLCLSTSCHFTWITHLCMYCREQLFDYQLWLIRFTAVLIVHNKLFKYTFFKCDLDISKRQDVYKIYNKVYNKSALLSYCNLASRH